MPLPVDLVELPALPPSMPRRGNAFTRVLGRTVIRLLGWRIAGAFPDTTKFVMIGAPHTSNWDGVVGLSAAMALGIDIHVFAKHTLFWGPMGWALRALGGIPVDRSSSERADLVETAIQEFITRDTFILGVAPEGTRRKAEGWKTGFHRIAMAADVPVLLIVFDHGNKRVGPIATLIMTGDLGRDLTAIADIYGPIQGKNPENTTLPSPAQLRTSEASPLPS
jgi:1-acyl-sn-glycerol-3-phosphate acyltransferase